MKQVLTLYQNQSDYDALFKYCDHISSFTTQSPYKTADDCLLLIDFATLTQAHTLTLLKKLEQFTPKQSTLNVYIVISGCERILGFEPFFNITTTSERQQILAIADDAKPLLNAINSQLLTRLHHEPVFEKRKLIEFFPAQFEKANEIANQLRQQIDAIAQCCVKKIYFCSIEQKQTATNLLNDYQSSLPPSMTEKDYFVKDIFKDIIIQVQQHQCENQKQDKKRKGAIPITIAAVSSFVIACQFSYQQLTHNIQKIQSSKLKLNTQFTRLNQLHSAIDKLNDSNPIFATAIGLPQAKHALQHLNLLYQTELQTRFFPFIEKLLTEKITANIQSNPLDLFQSLKIYLMLTTHQHFDAQAILDWLPQTLHTHLRNLFRLPIDQWPQNRPLIKTAQFNLQQLSPATLALLSLQKRYQSQQVSLASLLEQDPSIDLSQVTIAKLYNPQQFKQIYSEEIPQIVAAFDKDSWVIGATHNTDIESTIKHVQAQYIQAFSKAWQTVAPAIKLKPATNFTELKNLINEVINTQSNLNTLNQFIIGNATLDKSTGTETTQLLQQFLQHDESYQQTKTALLQLQAYLDTILNEKNGSKQSYLIAIDMINHPNTNNPIHQVLTLNTDPSDPRHQWLNTIAKSSWALVIDHAKNNISLAYH